MTGVPAMRDVVLRFLGGVLAAAMAMPLAAQGMPEPVPAASVRYAVLFVGSAHVGDADLEGFNPGLGIGWRRPTDWCDQCESAFEMGVFRNSYEEIAPYLASTLSREVWRSAGGMQARVGVLGGLARYAELAPRLRREHGIPTLGDVVPVVGVVAGLRWTDGAELRVKLVPPGADVDLVVAASVVWAW